MRMTRVNITVPDDVMTQARAAGLNVSRIATAALLEELDRRSKLHALDDYLARLEARWADQFTTAASEESSARRRSA
jgi:hypothetical protein